MRENDKPVLIYSTFPSAAEAERVGGALVDRRLAACVNIFPTMTAIYTWQGKRERGSEAAMFIKTRAALADKLHGKFSFDNVNESFFVAVGTPDQVVERLEEWGETMGTNHFVFLGAPGNMPNWKVVKNMNFLANDVMPRMRSRAGSHRRVAAE